MVVSLARPEQSEGVHNTHLHQVDTGGSLSGFLEVTLILGYFYYFKEPVT